MEKVVANLVQKIENRFYGKYRGLVVENADPEKLGRLKVKVPSVLGNEVVSGWAMPCTPYGGDRDQGFLFIPEVGAGVWVEFEEGDLEFPIWVGTFWSKPDGESELPKVADEIQNSPTQKIIKTKKGHTIQLEDADGKEKITIKHKDKSFFAIDENGSVIIGNQKGSTILLNSKDKNLMLVDEHANSVIMSEESITIVTKDGKVAIELSGSMARIAAEEIVMQGKSVVLGAAGAPTELEPTIKAKTFFSTIWATHTHPTALGPSGPPIPPVAPMLAAPVVPFITSNVLVK
ncbi:hypothetical protein JOY44_28660 (plasmid) [Phormidium sp. CLA17]|nr:hypothetical protein [Leptolyngbya sp. Cla-17]